MISLKQLKKKYKELERSNHNLQSQINILHFNVKELCHIVVEIKKRVKTIQEGDNSCS